MIATKITRARVTQAARRSGWKTSGFTLLELVIVMFVLMALAAIMIPLFPSMVERAHRASQGTNEAEITKAIQTYQGLNGTLPDGWDLLTDGTKLVNYLPASPTASPMSFGEVPVAQVANVVDGSTFPCGGYIHADGLTANALSALNGAGIDNEWAMLSGATLAGNASVNASYTGNLVWQPTFNPYFKDTASTVISTPGTANADGYTPLVVGTEVVYVYPTGLLVAGVANPTIINANGNSIVGGKSVTPSTYHQFVMFGLGKRCSIIGTGMNNAASNFPNDAVHENPDVVYERFGVIFQVEDNAGNALPSAACLGTVAIEANTLLSVDGTMASYTQNIQQISSPASGPGE